MPFSKIKFDYIYKAIIFFVIILICFVTKGFSKKKYSIQNIENIVDTIPVTPDSVYSTVEVPPKFPGGDSALNRYLTKQIINNLVELTLNKESGTCVVRFIVDTEGVVTDIHATTMKGSLLAKIAIKALENSPKWRPGLHNGRAVKVYIIQPVTFNLMVR